MAVPSACAARVVVGECGFIGNSDLYGLGIRLGIYIQQLAVCLSMLLLQKEAAGQIVAYNTFILSSVIALFVVSFDGECVFETEVIMLQYIIWTGYLHLAAWVMMRLFRPYSFSRAGTAVVLVLYSLPVFSYSFYFWLSIVRKRPTKFTPTPCGTSYFLFARISASNFQPASTFLLVQVGFYLAITSFLSLGIIAYIARSTWIQHTGRSESEWVTRLRRELDYDQEKFERISQYVLGGFALIFLCWIIIAVELPLRWNHVQDVYSLKSTGQFIPLITAISGCINLMYHYTGDKLFGMFVVGI